MRPFLIEPSNNPAWATVARIRVHFAPCLGEPRHCQECHETARPTEAGQCAHCAEPFSTNRQTCQQCHLDMPLGIAECPGCGAEDTEMITSYSPWHIGGHDVIAGCVDGVCDEE